MLSMLAEKRTLLGKAVLYSQVSLGGKLNIKRSPSAK
jgi:hypothetical protein